MIYVVYCLCGVVVSMTTYESIGHGLADQENFEHSLPSCTSSSFEVADKWVNLGKVTCDNLNVAQPCALE